MDTILTDVLNVASDYLGVDKNEFFETVENGETKLRGDLADVLKSKFSANAKARSEAVGREFANKKKEFLSSLENGFVEKLGVTLDDDNLKGVEKLTAAYELARQKAEQKAIEKFRLENNLNDDNINWDNVAKNEKELFQRATLTDSYKNTIEKLKNDTETKYQSSYQELQAKYESLQNQVVRNERYKAYETLVPNDAINLQGLDASAIETTKQLHFDNAMRNVDVKNQDGQILLYKDNKLLTDEYNRPLPYQTYLQTYIASYFPKPKSPNISGTGVNPNANASMKSDNTSRLKELTAIINNISSTKEQRQNALTEKKQLLK